MSRQSLQSSPSLQIREKITNLKSKFDSGSMSAEDQFNEMIEILVALVITLNLTEDEALNQFCKDLDHFTHQWVVNLNQLLSNNSIHDVNRIIADVRNQNLFMIMFKSIISVDCSSVPETAALPNMLMRVWNQYFYQTVINGYKKNGYFQCRETLLELIRQTDDAGLCAALANELLLLPFTHTAKSHMALFQPVTAVRNSEPPAPAAPEITFPIT